MKDKHKYSRRTHSYLALRSTVGWIGILLPFVLMLGVFLLFNEDVIHEDVIQKSISHYYHSGMGDVFVGALCAVAFFMFFYSGYDKWDDWAGNLVGLFAIGVALFPTTKVGPSNWIGIIHYVSAALFLTTLTGFSLFLFTQKDSKPTSQKLIRNNIYIVCGLIMTACLIAILIFFIFFDDGSSESSFVFWAETVALVTFGVSWFTKGGNFYPDKINSH